MDKIIFLSVFFLSTSVLAADWVKVAASNKEDYYIDKSFYSYKKSSKTIDVWWKTTNIQAEQPFTSSKALVQYDCVNKKSRYIAYTEFYGSGDPVNSNEKVSHNFRFIYPDSIDEAIWEASCKTNGGGFYFKVDDMDKERTRKIVEAYDKKYKKPVILQNSIAEKYHSKELTPKQIEDIESDIKNGLVKLPY